MRIKKNGQKLSTINPKIYEINFRIWVNNFSDNGKISGVAMDDFRSISEKGIDIIWLMGIWDTCDSVIKKCCFESGLIAAYNKALPDWKEEDVIGSPFSINKYEVNPLYGTWDDLKRLKLNLNKLGLKLFLDFIPNHFSSDSELIKSNPEFFLQADEQTFKMIPTLILNLNIIRIKFLHMDVIRFSRRGQIQFKLIFLTKMQENI